MDHQQVTDFLTQMSMYRGVTFSNYQRAVDFSSHVYRDRLLAEEAVSNMVMLLYDGACPRLHLSWCFSNIRNYRMFRNNSEKAYLKHTVLVNEHTDSCEQAPHDELPSFSTFYEHELWREGILPEERIRQLGKLRSLYRSLDIFEKELYRCLYIEGMTLKQISEEKGIPKTSVWNMKNRLRDKISVAMNTNMKPLY